MKTRIGAFVVCLTCAIGARVEADIVVKDNLKFYSEGVVCDGTLYLPDGFGGGGRTVPVVVLPSVPGDTQGSVEGAARRLAANGIAAFTFDYRGWGKSGGFLYFGEPVRWDDRLRFTPMTAKMRIRRLRLDPKAQVIDIRNAITYLQGEAGIDRARIGVWGAKLAGDHAIVAAGSDARIKSVVAQQPGLAGRNETRRAFKPTAVEQATMVKLARTGSPPATQQAAKKMNEDESRLALAEYRPYWYLEQIPQTTAVLFIGAEGDTAGKDTATAAAKLLKGPSQVSSVSGAGDLAGEVPAKFANDWFAKHL